MVLYEPVETKEPETESCKECCHKTKSRSEAEYTDLIHRLNRMEGQVRGIKGMVEKDAYCTLNTLSTAVSTRTLSVHISYLNLLPYI